MKMSRKFTSIALAALMAATLSVPVMAENDQIPTERSIPAEYSLSAIDLDTVTSDLTWQVIDPTRYSKIEIGNYIPAYVWDGDELVSSEREVLFYPIYGDSQIVAILTMFDPHGDKGYTVGADFAPELNRAIASGAQDYFIVEAGSKIYLNSNGNTTLLKQTGEPEDIDADALMNVDEAEKASLAERQGPQADGQPNARAGISTDFDASNALTANQLDSYVSDSSQEFKTSNDASTTLSRSVTDDRLDITPTNYRQARTIRYLPVQKLTQGSTEQCTFYAATIIGNYKSGRNVSVSTVMNWLQKWSLGTIFDAQSIINSYFGQNYSYIYDIYGRAANEFISRGYPLYGAFYNSAKTKGHALCINGYSDSGDYGIYVMETLTGNYKAIYPASTSTYITRAYSQDCYWTATLYYKYW